jgi:endonuclease/exonuclease/phosphatase family metal-dependent hydrolase
MSPVAHPRVPALAEGKPEDKPAPKSVTKINVMTYNIRLGIESSLKSVGEAIIAAGVPDVLAVEEIGVDWHMGEKVDEPRVLAKQIGLPHHFFVGALNDKSTGRFGIALLCRWPLASADVRMLPLDTDEPRTLLRARVDAPTPFTVLVTHLARGSKDRLKQAPFVGAAAAAAEGPVVLCGDFNDVPTSATLKAIKGTLVDCFEAAGTGPGETFSVKSPKDRIDYIFCGAGFEPVGPAAVVTAAVASDHFPLTAVVGPKAPASSAPTSKPSGSVPLWRPEPWFRAPFVSPPPR